MPKLDPNKPKSLFTSIVFWGAIATGITAISPYITKPLIDREPVKASDFDAVIGIVAGTIITIIGRIQATGPVYTPKGLIGSNKEDYYTEGSELIDRREVEVPTSPIDDQANN